MIKKKYVKRCFSILLGIMMVFLLIACGSSEDGSASSPATEAPALEPIPGSDQTQAHADSTTETLAQELTLDEVVSKAQVGDTVLFGSYEQDNDTTTNPEPIEWMVLDKQDNKALVISRYGLDCQPYNETYTGWETCTLRMWLNSEFYNTAFSEEEKASILMTTLDNPNNDVHETSDNATEDRVFCLSLDEVNRYFGADEANRDNKARAAKPTAYAVGRGAYVDTTHGGNCVWWLRTPDGQYHTAIVFGSGELGGGRVDNKEEAVRPALWVSFRKTEITVDSDGSEATAASGMSQYTESSDNPEVIDNGRNDMVSNKLPYIELFFSPEDFKVAGYSPADGDHLDEVYEIVSENLPLFSGYNTGWMYSSEIHWPGKVIIVYAAVRGNGPETISYTVNRQELLGEPPFADKKRVRVHIGHNDGGVAGDEYPLVESPVMPGITYEETLEALRIENIVTETTASTWAEIIDNPNVGYFFESQYGKTVCRYMTFGEGMAYDTQIEICAANLSMDLFFNKGILESVDCMVSYGLDE